MSSTALATGIYNYSQVASAFKTAISGRVYQVRAPQTPTYPFVIFFFVSDVPDYYFTAPSDSQQAIFNVQFQFNVYSKSTSMTEINSISDALVDRFDFASLTVSGYNVSKLERTAKYPPVWIEEIQGFVSSIVYNIQMKKS